MHVILAGAGNVGRYLTERLVAEDQDVVVVDERADVLEELSSAFDISAVLGSASAYKSLKRAGIERADIFLAATNSDETNLLSCLIARSVNPKTKILARVKDLVTDESGLTPGIIDSIDEFINPDNEASNFFLDVLDSPGTCDTASFAGGKVRLTGIKLTANMTVASKPIKELTSLQSSCSMLVVAIVRDGHLIVARGDDVLQEGDIIYIASEPENVKLILEALGVEQAPVQKVLIWGSTEVAARVAIGLQQKGVNVKVIISEKQRCEYFAGRLNGILVLEGEGTDQELLVEEGVADCDAFVAATDHDEDNILSALLADRLGASTTGVVLDKFEYESLVPNLGIPLVVNPRLVAASSILKFVRGQGIATVFAMRDKSAEILEVTVAAKSKICNRPLKDAKLPHGVNVLAVVRDEEVVIPRGMNIIEEGDTVLVFAKKEVVPKVARYLGAD